MAIANEGSQKITFDFRNRVKGSDFNYLLRDLLKPGIYSGLIPTIGTSNAVTFSAGNIGINCKFGTTDRLFVKVDFQSSFTKTIDQTDGAQNEIIYIEYTYLEVEENWAEIKHDSLSNYLSLENVDNTIVIAEAEYVAGVLTSFDFERRTFGLLDADSNYSIKDNQRFSDYATGLKKFYHDASSISSGEERSLSIPNRNHQIGAIDSWIASTNYLINDQVIYHELIFRCITANNDSTFTPTKWQIVGAKGSATTITQSSPTLVIGNPVYHNGTAWQKARADAVATFATAIVGFVDGNNYTILHQGKITLTTAQWDTVAGTTGGLTAGTRYFLSASTAGSITSISAASNNPILFALSSTEAIFIPFIQDAVSDYIAASLLTTKGDIIVRNSTQAVRKGIGTDDYVLTGDSSTAEGLDWKRPMFIPRRQSVLTGKVDANGWANFLSASGLNISIDATPTNIQLSFAYGSDDRGAIDYLTSIEADVSNAWTLPGGLTVSSMTRSGTTVTVTTSAAHGLAVGDYVRIEATQAGYNGEWPVTSISSATVFTWTLSGTTAVTTPATGVTCKPMYFLYADRNSSTGAITYGYSRKLFHIDNIAKPSPTTGQHWFNPEKFEMREYDGADWDLHQRIFLGEALVDSASAIEIRHYELNGGYSGFTFNTDVANTDTIIGTGDFGYGAAGNLVPSVATSNKQKVVRTGILREGQYPQLELRYSGGVNSFSSDEKIWLPIYAVNDSTIGGVHFYSAFIGDTNGNLGVVVSIWAATGFNGVTWSTLAGAGMRWRVRIVKRW